MEKEVVQEQTLKSRLISWAVGLIIAYCFYYFVAKSGNLVTKLIFGAIAGFAWWKIVKIGVNRIQRNYNNPKIGTLGLIISMMLSIGTFEQFDKYTYGSREEQRQLLIDEPVIVVAKIIDIIHTPPMRIRRNDIPEFWEVEYQFIANDNEEYIGHYRSDKLPQVKINDTLSIKYAESSPIINKSLTRR